MSELSELFERDPLKLTREDLTKVIQKYREDRVLYMRGEKKAAKPSSPKIDLDSLDI